MTYQVEYISEYGAGWLKAGFELTESQLILDYHKNRDKYARGERRAFKVERTLVKFKTVVTIA